MRRGYGVQRKKIGEKNKKAFITKNEEVQANSLKDITVLIQNLKEKLELFALKQRKRINEDSEFRQQFQHMCANIGIDILATKNGFWNKVLKVNDFYYQLNTEILQLFLFTKSNEGGFLSLPEVLVALNKKRIKMKIPTLSEDDIEKAVNSISCLGKTVELFTDGKGLKYLVFGTNEGKKDEIEVISTLQLESKGLDIFSLCEILDWKDIRGQTTVNRLLRKGKLWVDCVKEDKMIYFLFLF